MNTIKMLVLLAIGMMSHTVYPWYLYVTNATKYYATIQIGRAGTTSHVERIAPGQREGWNMREWLNDGVNANVEVFTKDQYGRSIATTIGAKGYWSSGQRAYSEFVLYGGAPATTSSTQMGDFKFYLGRINNQWGLCGL